MEKFLRVSLGRARASRDHFFAVIFCLWTSMNCGTATMTVCLLQKLWFGHNGCVLLKLNGKLSGAWESHL